MVGIEPDLLAAYHTYFAPRNAWMNHGNDMLDTGKVWPSEALCPDGTLKKTDFYNDWLKKINGVFGFGACVFKEDLVFSNVTVLRPERAGKLNREDLRLVEILMPHIQRALQIHRRLAGLRLKHHTALEVLDRLPVGTLLVDSRGRVLLMNREASRIASRRDGLTVEADGLHGCRSADTAALRRLVSEASRTSSREGLHAGGILSLPRPSLLRPLELLVAPIRLGTFALDAEAATAIVLVTDPEHRPGTNESVLRGLYSLTPAEARLAGLLLQGNGLESSAELLGIAIETVRHQIKDIYRKTGTGRQAELVRVMSMGLAGVSERNGTDGVGAGLLTRP